MSISDDEWFELSEKIDMIPNEETAALLRNEYLIEERARLRNSPWHNDFSRNRIAHAVNSILAKYGIAEGKTVQGKAE